MQEYILAVDGIGILCPGKGTGACGADVGASDPRGFLRAVGPIIDAGYQGLRPGGVFRYGSPTCCLLDHLRVPAVMQICGSAVPGGDNVVATKFQSLVVQWLGNVSKEMD